MKGCCVPACPLATVEELSRSGLAIHAAGGRLFCDRHASEAAPDAVLLWDPVRHCSSFRDATSAAGAVARAVWDPSSARSLLFPEARSEAEARALAGG